ncbi:helix-turn-helix transcriptional regulator [Variovorax sp. Root434]|uniref:helix-turn-helix domain-containing protein n=1 Tax=Variovorax sp. Root434 TaxID=1736536 RepID=UPI002AA2A946|nr:helix-turn-helix transcriptional regulator [Variovorax sp. Root434]
MRHEDGRQSAGTISACQILRRSSKLKFHELPGKEVRAEIEALRKSSVAHRASIAGLRRQVDALEKALRRAVKGSVRTAASEAEVAADSGVKRRFSASRLSAHRAKLGLSAARYGQLIGVSGQTIYHWEQGKARPRAAQLEGLASVRDLGASEIASRLGSL